MTASGNGAKGDFVDAQRGPVPQHSVKINSINNAFHLTMYTGLRQANQNLRLNSGNQGQCWSFANPGWLSYGVYNQ